MGVCVVDGESIGRKIIESESVKLVSTPKERKIVVGEGSLFRSRRRKK